MAVDWMLRGPELVSCNCAWGCPCQFNSLPTYGDCRATAAMHIDEGYFGEVRLDGLRWACTVAWPGAIHEGGGEILPIVDERADEAQRNALLTIMSGEETVPGATFFNVFMSMIDTVHDPKFLPIEFSLDVDNRVGRFSVPGIVDASVEPILNPITKQPHRARINLPQGFEYRTAEMASGTVSAQAPVALDWAGRHCHVTDLHITGTGPVG